MILEKFITKTKKELYCPACNKIAVRNTYTKLVASDLVADYIKNTDLLYNNARNRTIFQAMCTDLVPPYYLGMYFLRKMDNGWDFNNASQIITDLLQKNGYVTDDSVRNLIPVYLGHHKNDESPGLVMIVLRNPLEMTKLMLEQTYEYFKRDNINSGSDPQ